MWSQSWVNLYQDTKPFANSTVRDVTANMKAQHYDAFKMFEISDEFYMSLGLPSSKMSYTGKSIIVKPADQKIIQCHASAFVSILVFQSIVCIDIAAFQQNKNEQISNNVFFLVFVNGNRTFAMAKISASKCARVLMKKIWLLFTMKWVSIESLFTFDCLQSKLNFLAPLRVCYCTSSSQANLSLYSTHEFSKIYKTTNDGSIAYNILSMGWRIEKLARKVWKFVISFSLMKFFFCLKCNTKHHILTFSEPSLGSCRHIYLITIWRR